MRFKGKEVVSRRKKCKIEKFGDEIKLGQLLCSGYPKVILLLAMVVCWGKEGKKERNGWVLKESRCNKERNDNLKIQFEMMMSWWDQNGVNYCELGVPKVLSAVLVASEK